MKEKGHRITKVLPGSIAEELEIAVDDILLEINGKEVVDIFDYRYFMDDTYVEVLIRKPNGEEIEWDIDKEYQEDLGIEFENGLMDKYRSCKNKCMFCFIDQMPKGMRETLYFKDDDARLSFLQGNYITLTNMKEKDIERIIFYHLTPINISVHTTNPELRCKMLHNRFAGEALKQIDKLYKAEITMNGQIVLCKGVNDGKELERTIRELSAYLPYMQSVSVVPVGLTKHREGLYPLEPFSKEDAKEVLSLIHHWQNKLYQKYGNHFIHAGDEWYILAGYHVPKEERYDGYCQLENGVGMIRLFQNEWKEALAEKKGDNRKISISMATGKLAYPYIRQALLKVAEKFPNVTVRLYQITNEFFGEHITVAGLITGQDLIKQLTGQELGEILLLPAAMFRSGEQVFLDDITKEELEKALQVKVNIVKSSGQDFLSAVLMEEPVAEKSREGGKYEL